MKLFVLCSEAFSLNVIAILSRTVSLMRLCDHICNCILKNFFNVPHFWPFSPHMRLLYKHVAILSTILATFVAYIAHFAIFPNISIDLMEYTVGSMSVWMTFLLLSLFSLKNTATSTNMQHINAGN